MGKKSRTAAVASWSGGKDSCLACYKAIKGGYDIRYLLNFISREYRRCCFHGIQADLLKLQAELIGIPIIQAEVTDDMQAYEAEFKQAVTNLTGGDIRTMVFGDVYLLDHYSWVERVCADLKIAALEPLWERPADKILEEFVDHGFKAVIVSCKDDPLGRDFIGRVLDKDIIKEFRAKKVCPCGENGEFHTLVVDGPLFKRKIEILESEPVFKDGFWKHWFLDIKKYR